MKKYALIFTVLVLVTPAFAWDGYDYGSGSSVEVEKGQLVRPGRDIEFYDYGEGEYRQGEVQSMRDRGSSVEVEVYDQESGEYRTFEMEKN